MQLKIGLAQAKPLVNNLLKPTSNHEWSNIDIVCLIYISFLA